ncbi:MAG: YbjN domain-containing protein [Sandaracinaceae bacterium]|nr:YbjN domain-containing protein [Sandaracinaceae bacterium]
MRAPSLASMLPWLLVAALAAPAAAQPPTAPEPTAEPAEPAAPGQPRYLAAMQRELEAMRVRGARCEATDAQRGRCQFSVRGMTTGRDFTVHLVYSDRTDTVYLYVERYLSAPADGASTDALLRRLMELNWSLLLGKFEWSSSDGEVRLAMILNTDSNFDRRAFRSAVRGIGQLADRYFNELDRLTRGQAGE